MDRWKSLLQRISAASDQELQPALNGVARLVLVCLGIDVAMFFVMAFTDDNLSFWITMVTTALGGGGAVSAIRGGGRKNVCVGIAGLLWIIVPVASLAYQIYWASRIGRTP